MNPSPRPTGDQVHELRRQLGYRPLKAVADVLALFDDRPFHLREHRRYDARRASQWSGATERQVRYWDQIGLVRPSVQSTDRRPGRSRIYSFDDVRRLRMVVGCLQSGLSLQAIRYLIAKGMDLSAILQHRRKGNL